MAVYAVIVSTNPDAVGQAVAAQYGATHFKFDEKTWFVTDVGSSRAVADKLGITNGTAGSHGVVLTISGYSGFARTDAWTWLQQFPETKSNG